MTHPTPPPKIFIFRRCGQGLGTSGFKCHHGGSRLAVVFSSWFVLPSCLLWKEKSHKGGMGLTFQLVSKCMFLRNDFFVEMSAMASRDVA